MNVLWHIYFLKVPITRGGETPNAIQLKKNYKDKFDKKTVRNYKGKYFSDALNMFVFNLLCSTRKNAQSQISN